MPHERSLAEGDAAGGPRKVEREAGVQAGTSLPQHGGRGGRPGDHARLVLAQGQRLHKRRRCRHHRNGHELICKTRTSPIPHRSLTVPGNLGSRFQEESQSNQPDSMGQHRLRHRRMSGRRARGQGDRRGAHHALHRGWLLPAHGTGA